MNLSKILWIALCLCPQFCLSQGHGTKVASSGETKLSSVVGKIKIEVVFQTSITPASNNEHENRRFVQCTYSRIPCSLTDSIRVSIDGKEIFIPRSAFADLGDISTAELAMSNGRLILTIKGGDASESYIAKLLFNNDRLSERRLYSGEDPEHPLEVSRYYQVTSSD